MNKSILPTIYPVTCHTHHVGPGSTFVAIKGMKDNGLQYIAEALALGATRIVIDEKVVLQPELVHLIKEKKRLFLLFPIHVRPWLR